MKIHIEKKYTAATFVVVAVIFIMTVLSVQTMSSNSVQYLVMTNAYTGELYFKEPLEEDGVFSVSYIHSVNKSNVEEYYRMEDGTLYLFRARYRAFGAGVATEIEEGQTLTYEDGYMIIGNIHYAIPNLVYKVGTVSDPLIHIGDRFWHMKELAPSLTSVRFEITH